MGQKCDSAEHAHRLTKQWRPPSYRENSKPWLETWPTNCYRLAFLELIGEEDADFYLFRSFLHDVSPVATGDHAPVAEMELAQPVDGIRRWIRGGWSIDGLSYDRWPLGFKSEPPELAACISNRRNFT